MHRLFVLQFDSSSFEADDKKALLSAFTEELFYNLEKPFRVLKNGKEIYRSEALCARDLKALEELKELEEPTGCANGACSIF